MIKHTLIALVTGATVIGCVATAAHATGPLSTEPTAAPLVATRTHSLTGGLTRSTGSARVGGEGRDDGGRATLRHPVRGDETAQRRAVVNGVTPARQRSDDAGASTPLADA